MTDGLNVPPAFVDLVPTLRPSMSEFRNGDLIEFARSARDLLARYGAVRVDPPREWQWHHNGPLDPVLLQIPDTMFSTVVPNITGGIHDDASRVHEFRLRAVLPELAQIGKTAAAATATAPASAAAATTATPVPNAGAPNMDGIEQQFWDAHIRNAEKTQKDSKVPRHSNPTPKVLSAPGPLTAVLEQRGNSLLHMFDLRQPAPPELPELVALGQSHVQLEPMFYHTDWQADPNGLLLFSFHHGGPRRIWYVAPAKPGVMDGLDPIDPEQVSWGEATDDRPVHKVVQKAGTFVIIAPWARYTTLAVGLATIEQVLVATPDWVTCARKLRDLRQKQKTPLHVPADAIMWKFARRKASTQGFNPMSATSVALGDEIKSMIHEDQEHRQILSGQIAVKEVVGRDVSKAELKIMGPAGPICRSCQYRPFLSTVVCRECRKGSLCLTCALTYRGIICDANEHQLYILRRHSDPEIEKVSNLLQNATSSVEKATSLPQNGKRKAEGDAAYNPFG